MTSHLVSWNAHDLDFCQIRHFTHAIVLNYNLRNNIGNNNLIYNHGLINTISSLALLSNAYEYFLKLHD